MTQKKENLIIQLKEEEMKNRSRSLFQRTANAFEEDKREALQVGMNEHITKQINIHELIQELDRILKK